jgi:sialic acid synthase SpsE
VARRSITAARTIEAGKLITEEDLCLKRPAQGLPPGKMSKVLGRIAKTRIPDDSQLVCEMLVGEEAVLEER